MCASTSRYRVFETTKFRNAPVSKFWALSTLAGSVCAIPFRHNRTSFTFDVQTLFNFKRIIKLVVSRIFILELKDIIAGCLLIYFMRHIERRHGSRKYADFLIFTSLTAVSIEIIIHGILSWFDVLSTPTVSVSYGPYALLFSSFLQFCCDVPFVPYAKVFYVPLSVKNLPLLFIIQMLISTKNIVISCVSGLLAGLIYRSNVFDVQNLRVIPDWLCKPLWSAFSTLLGFGENTTGRLLPIGATADAQQQDFYDQYEQNLIYQRIRRQHSLDERSAGEHSLSAGQRWFGRRRQPPSSPTVQVCEEKVRTLVEMGFADRDRVVQVLRNTNNDLNSAALVLLQDASRTVY